MRFVSIFITVIVALNLAAQNLPVGYITQFECDFSVPTFDTNLIFSPASSVKIDKGLLLLEEKADSIKRFVPSAAMIIDYHIFGDFISEITIFSKQNIIDSTAGIFIICGLRNGSNYYMVNFNGEGAIFSKMYKGAITELSCDSSFVINYSKPVKFRIEREILGRSITVKAQGKNAVFTDPNLVMGYFGIGAEDSKITVDKLIIWAPTSMAEKAPLFP